MPQRKRRVRTEDEHHLVALLSEYGDDTFVNVMEVAALTGYSHHTIRQRKIQCLPSADRRMKHLRWRLGDIRRFINAGSDASVADIDLQPKKIGRPKKAIQLREML